MTEYIRNNYSNIFKFIFVLGFYFLSLQTVPNMGHAIISSTNWSSICMGIHLIGFRNVGWALNLPISWIKVERSLSPAHSIWGLEFQNSYFCDSSILIPIPIPFLISWMNVREYVRTTHWWLVIPATWALLIMIINIQMSECHFVKKQRTCIMVMWSPSSGQPLNHCGFGTVQAGWRGTKGFRLCILW